MFQPCDDLDKAEAVHRGAFMWPVRQTFAQKGIDRLAICLVLNGRKVHADISAQIEPFQGAGETRDRLLPDFRVLPPVNIHQRHCRGLSEQQRSAGKIDLLACRIPPQIFPVCVIGKAVRYGDVMACLSQCHDKVRGGAGFGIAMTRLRQFQSSAFGDGLARDLHADLRADADAARYPRAEGLSAAGEFDQT